MRSTMNYVTRLALLAVLALSAGGCGVGGGQAATPIAPAPTSTAMPVPTTEPTNEPAPQPTGTIGGKTEAGKAMVDSVEVQIRESLPVQVSVNVKGNLPDACTQIADINTTRDGNTFNVDISTTRPVEVLCAQVLTPFEENVSLDVKGLKKGTYTVNANGVTKTFELK